MSTNYSPWVDYQRTGNVNAFADVGIGGSDNLGDATIEGWVRRGHGVLKQTAVLEAELYDAANRIVRVHYGDDDGWLASARPGTWYLQFWMHWPDDSEFVFPGKAAPSLRIIVADRTKPPAP